MKHTAFDTAILELSREPRNENFAGVRQYEETRPAAFGILDVLAFLIPVTSFIEVEIIGRLFAPDLLLAAIIPFLLLLRKDRVVEFVDKLHRTFLLLAGLWLFGQVVTDLVRHTPFYDWTRGWAKIVFTMINFWSLWMLMDGRPRRIVLYSAGLALGGILVYFVNPSGYAFSHPWKFGYGGSVTWLIVLLVCVLYQRMPFRGMLAFALLSGIAFFNIMMGFRSLGGLLFLIVFFLAFRSSIKQTNVNIRLRGKKNFVLFVISVSLGGLVALTLYSTLAESGFLGENARALYERQSQGAYGVLLGGRSEVLSSAMAVIDSPIIGHGSWAKDCQYTDILMEMKRRLGYIPGAENDVCLIPTHSIILGAWVEAGFLGAVLWLWVGFLAVKTLMAVFQKNTKLAPLVTFFGFLLLWDLAFSPYGANRRFIATFFVVVLITALNWIQKERKGLY